MLTMVNRITTETHIQRFKTGKFDKEINRSIDRLIGNDEGKN